MPENIDYKQLQQQQMAGTAKTTKGNQASDYQFPEVEKNLVHLRLTHRVHNPAKQDYESHSKVLQLEPRDFEAMEREDAFKGYYSSEILHDPRKATEIKAASEVTPLVTGAETLPQFPGSEASAPIDSDTKGQELTDQPQETNSIEPVKAKR